jgi:IS1 family transposase
MGMNRLTTTDRTRIVACLVEGVSVRATCRITGFAKGTVLGLLADLGEACERFHDDRVRGLRAERVQCDEVWAYCYSKEKNVPEGMRDKKGVGSVWTWKALDTDSKLLIGWHIGGRGQSDATQFMLDLAGRITTRIQLTTDGHGVYPQAVWESFGTDIDFAQLIKTYGAPRESEARYSPAICTGSFTSVRCGCPIPRDICTSHVERSNLNLRMNQRRWTRLTNGFSKKFENLCAAMALYAVHYNFCRVHQTLRVTPAMEAGLTDHVWTLAELVGLLEAEESSVIGTAENKRGQYKRNRNALP